MMPSGSSAFASHALHDAIDVEQAVALDDLCIPSPSGTHTSKNHGCCDRIKTLPACLCGAYAPELARHMSLRPLTSACQCCAHRGGISDTVPVRQPYRST